MKLQQQKNLMFLIIPSSILIVAWIIFTVYSRSVASTINEKQALTLTQIAPTFDTATLDTLKARKKVKPLMTTDPNAIIEGSETAPVASQSGSTVPQNASESAQTGGLL